MAAYGYTLPPGYAPVELVNLRVIARGPTRARTARRRDADQAKNPAGLVPRRGFVEAAI
jgi:hypothetical protein